MRPSSRSATLSIGSSGPKISSLVPQYDLSLVSEPGPARLQVIVRATDDPRPLVATVRHLGSTYKTE